MTILYYNNNPVEPHKWVWGGWAVHRDWVERLFPIGPQPNKNNDHSLLWTKKTNLHHYNQKCTTWQSWIHTSHTIRLNCHKFSITSTNKMHDSLSWRSYSTYLNSSLNARHLTCSKKHYLYANDITTYLINLTRGQFFTILRSWKRHLIC